MSWLRSVLTEIWGLFVDDGRFAATIVAWLVICGLLLPLLEVPAELKGPILFAGLGIVLVESTLRRARS
jgi:hypothetical protein